MTLLQLARTILPLVILVTAPLQAKEWTRVRIATEGAYPPYNFHKPDGSLAGFEIDLANDLCRRIKAECEIVAQDWDGIIPGLNAGKFDGIMSGMSITPKRLEVIDFSLPYASSPTTLVVTKDSPLVNLPGEGTRVRLQDAASAQTAIDALKAKLKGKIIAVQVSTIQADFLATYLKDIVEVRTYKTTDETFLDLAAGRVDAVLSSAANAKAAMDTTDGKDLVFTGPTINGGLIGLGSGIGIRKADADLRQLFDGAIQAATADGTISRLSVQWFKIDLTPR